MKTIGTKALFGVAVLSALWAATPASANPITDTVDPTDTTIAFGSTPSCPAGFTCSTTSALSFVHDITNNGFNDGDIITSATVAIHLTDSTGSEDYTFTIGSQTFSSKNVPGGGGGSTDVITFDVSSLADLELDGKIDITVSSTSGNFIFADSTLTAQVTSSVRNPDAVAVVPEPATLALFGLGFLGFAASRRKSARNNTV